jgi:hypothetical protein
MYSASFVLIQFLHWTLATKQPAMTAPAMAAKLKDLSRGDAVEDFRGRGHPPGALAGRGGGGQCGHGHALRAADQLRHLPGQRPQHDQPQRSRTTCFIR